MLIGVLADTHDNMPKIASATELFARRGVAMILHAGDFVAPFALRLLMKPGIALIGVFGNNDGERRGLQKLCSTLHEAPHRFELGGRVIVLAHDAVELSGQVIAGADLLVHAHDHEARIGPGPPLTLNPGEAGGWLAGRSTAAVLELTTMQAEIVDLGSQETVPI